MKTRTHFYDILKIIAIWLVLIAHTGSDAAYRYTETEGFSRFFSYFIREISISGPFIFFAISGTLLLRREEDLKKVLKDRVARYLIVLVVFSLFQLLYWNAVNGSLSEFSILGAFSNMYSSPVITQYWFLYSYLGMLLMLPFLRMIAKKMDVTHALYLMGLFLLLDFVCPLLESLFDLKTINMSLEVLAIPVFLPLAGYSLDVILDDQFRKVRNRIILYAISILYIGLNTFRSYRNYLNSGTAEDWVGTYYVIALALFVLTKALWGDHRFKERTGKVLEFFGGSTLVIYLLEPQIRDWTHFIYSALEPVIGWFFATFIWLNLAIVFGAVIAYIVHLIPGSKKFV